MHNFKHLEDEACAAHAQRGERAAFSVLVLRYQDRIYRFLVRLTRAPDEAMELAQETFLGAYQALGQWQPETHFSPWLFRIARNLAFDWLRRDKRVQFLPLEDDDDHGPAFADPAPAPDAVLETRQRLRHLEAALALLAPEHREILLLREIEDMSYQDIAAVLALNVGTVKSRIARARGALLEKIPHLLEEPR